MPKIIHTSDLHLGMRFSGMGRAGNRLRGFLRDAFASICDLTLESNADCLIIAGDLFDSKMVSQSTYDFVIDNIKRLGDIPVIIIPGRNDTADEILIWDNFLSNDIPHNLHLISNEDQNPLVISSIETAFWAKPNFSGNRAVSPLPKLLNRSAAKYNIAIANGKLMQTEEDSGDNAFHPINPKMLEKSDFNYIALGGNYSYWEIPEYNAYCPGSPERNCFGEDDCGYVLIVDVNDNGVEVEKVKIGKTNWYDITLNTEIMRSPGDILKELESYSGDNNLIRCRIEGLQLPGMNFDTELLEKELEDNICFVQVSDHTSPEKIDKLIQTFPPSTITGQFAAAIKEQMEDASPEMQEILEESLKLGCRLMAGGKLEL